MAKSSVVVGVMAMDRFGVGIRLFFYGLIAGGLLVLSYITVYSMNTVYRWWTLVDLQAMTWFLVPSIFVAWVMVMLGLVLMYGPEARRK